MTSGGSVDVLCSLGGGYSQRRMWCCVRMWCALLGGVFDATHFSQFYTWSLHVSYYIFFSPKIISVHG